MSKSKNPAAPELKRSPKELLWQQRLNCLILFRSDHPHKWPQSRSKDENERKLGIWCQSIRLDFRRGSLTESKYSDLKRIGFNFRGEIDNWTIRFEKLKNYLEKNKKWSSTGNEVYDWGLYQFNQFKNLSPEKKQLLNSINFLSYFGKWKAWTERFAELEKHMLTHKKTPTIASSPFLYSWLKQQKTKYNQGVLSKKYYGMLMKAGIDLSVNEQENTWNQNYESVIKFKKLNGRMPGPSIFSNEHEKKTLPVVPDSKTGNGKESKKPQKPFKGKN